MPDPSTGSPEPSPPNGPVLDIRGLSKTFGSFRAVSGLDLQVSRGEIFALLGPNGSGKTTTIRMLMGILQPTSGTASVDGHDCFRDRVEVMRRVGYLPDEPVFYEYLRGSEIIRFVGEMHGLRRDEVDARSGALIERFGLLDAIEEYAINYSRGMKKKLALVCALLHDPLLLILDEPTSGLDPLATRTLLDFIRKESARKTVFFSTHLLGQAEELCHRAGILFEGKLAAVGTLEALREELSPGGSLEEVFFAVTAPEPSGESP
jgi:ABC-2 type transport system ATP-binding protein